MALISLNVPDAWLEWIESSRVKNGLRSRQAVICLAIERFMAIPGAHYGAEKEDQSSWPLTETPYVCEGCMETINVGGKEIPNRWINHCNNRETIIIDEVRKKRVKWKCVCNACLSRGQ